MFYTIGHLEILQRKILEKPLWYFDTNNDKGVKKIFKNLKTMTGYQYDNNHLKWSNIFGHLFSISIHYSKHSQTWDINIWDHTGSTTLDNLSQKVVNKETDVLSSNNYKQICKITKDFVQGLINCSRCNQQIKKSEIAGHYFAGSYCQKCWESKYKAIEAKENYN